MEILQLLVQPTHRTKKDWKIKFVPQQPQAIMQRQRTSGVYRADLLHYTEALQDISQESK